MAWFCIYDSQCDGTLVTILVFLTKKSLSWYLKNEQSIPRLSYRAEELLIQGYWRSRFHRRHRSSHRRRRCRPVWRQRRSSWQMTIALYPKDISNYGADKKHVRVIFRETKKKVTPDEPPRRGWINPKILPESLPPPPPPSPPPCVMAHRFFIHHTIGGKVVFRVTVTFAYPLFLVVFTRSSCKNYGGLRNWSIANEQWFWNIFAWPTPLELPSKGCMSPRILPESDPPPPSSPPPCSFWKRRQPLTRKCVLALEDCSVPILPEVAVTRCWSSIQLADIGLQNSIYHTSSTFASMK